MRLGQTWINYVYGNWNLRSSRLQPFGIKVLAFSIDNLRRHTF